MEKGGVESRAFDGEEAGAAAGVVEALVPFEG
jgi:hypothetical protein